MNPTQAAATTSPSSPEIQPLMMSEQQSEITGKTVLVTGGTGSFGKQFCAEALGFNPKKLIIFSRDELKQYEMAQDPKFADHPEVRFFIGDVRDSDRLEMAFRNVDVVVHAAAMKHISAAEYNPFECIRTNVYGAENIVQAALRTQVKKVIALSTDKAVNPVNLYGASKLASDRILLAARALSGSGGPQFSVVRYGNVVGSRGSVVPFFQKLIDEGADSLPITDPRMTRFWITLQQGVNFVFSSLANMHGGEIFIPKIPSMKVLDLAAAMAPGGATHVIGIRAGEKLHEAMIDEHEARSALEYDDRYSVVHDAQSREQILSELGGQTVPENFSYSSNLNTQWLDGDQMRALLAEVSP